MTDLRELEKRLEEATECNQELDAALWSLWDKRPLEGPADGLRIYKRDPEDCGAFDLPPNYTASLDAAVALVERLLPGWEWERKCETNRGKFVRLIGPEFHKYEFMGPHNKHCTAWIFGETTPLALCLALIRALM